MTTATASRPDPHPRWAAWSMPAAAAILILDQASKWALQAHVVDDRLPAHWPSFLQWHYNTGVAWSAFAGMPGLVALATAVLIPVLAWVWLRHYRSTAVENLAFGLVLGGALGNGIDRLLAQLGEPGVRGVRDFIHVDLGVPFFDPFPTFNIADAGITIGAVLLVAWSFRPRRVARSGVLPCD